MARAGCRSLIKHCIPLLSSVLAFGLVAPVQAQALQPQAPSSNPAAARKILVVGDSLSAEYGLQRGQGWVSLLEQRLVAEKWRFDVVNASVSGDTTSGGRSRLPALLQRHAPSHVVLELGGNDALRGLPLQMTEANLNAMVKAALEAKAKVTLVGMQVPPNYGPSYSRDFESLFVRVAQQHKVDLVPFLLKGVADVPQASQFFQSDRIHPNEAAQPLLLANVWPVLRRQLSPP